MTRERLSREAVQDFINTFAYPASSGAETTAAPKPNRMAVGTRAKGPDGAMIELGEDGSWLPVATEVPAEPGPLAGTGSFISPAEETLYHPGDLATGVQVPTGKTQSYVDMSPDNLGLLSQAMGFDPGTMIAMGVRDAVTGLARLPFDLVGADETSASIGRGIPQIRSDSMADTIGGGIYQYAAPGLAAVKGANAVLAGAPALARVLGGAAAAGATDAAVTDPSLAASLGDLLGGPTDINPGDGALEARGKVGAEGGLLVAGLDALLRGGARLFRGRPAAPPPEPGRGMVPTGEPPVDGTPGGGFNPANDDFAARQAEADARSQTAGARGAQQREEDILREFAERQRADAEADAQRARQERQARGEFEDDPAAAGKKYAGAKFSNKVPDPDAAFSFGTDDYGYVLSDTGAPVKFGDQKQAARWIINVGNKSGGNQVFELANHPVGQGFTVRVRAVRAAKEAADEGVGAAGDAGRAAGPEGEPMRAESPDPASRPAPIAEPAPELAPQATPRGAAPALDGPVSAAARQADEVSPVAREEPIAPRSEPDPAPPRDPETDMPEVDARPVRADKAITGAGREIDVEYAIVDADSLVASNLDDLTPNPDFPAKVQPRDRTRAASAGQVQDIAKRLRPELVAESPRASDGAPIVTARGVVESGNGRVLGIRRAYAEGGEAAQRYRDFLAEKGYPVDGVNKPVLVRVRRTDMTPEERVAFVREANERDTMGMSSIERASTDAEAITDDMLSLYRGGEVDAAGNRDFVRAFVRDIASKTDQAGLVGPDGTLSQEGIRRVQGAILSKAYGDTDIVAAMTEATDTNIRAIGGALLDVAPDWAKLRGRIRGGEVPADLDITDALVAAVKFVRDARRAGEKVGDAVAQNDMFGGGADPLVEDILSLMFRDPQYRRPAGRDSVADALRFYVDEANKAEAGPKLFGDMDDTTPNDVLGLAKEKQNVGRSKPESADLFAGGGGRKPPKGPPGGKGRPGVGDDPGGEQARGSGDAPKGPRDPDEGGGNDGGRGVGGGRDAAIVPTPREAFLERGSFADRGDLDGWLDVRVRDFTPTEMPHLARTETEIAAFKDGALHARSRDIYEFDDVAVQAAKKYRKKAEREMFRSGYREAQYFREDEIEGRDFQSVAEKVPQHLVDEVVSILDRLVPGVDNKFMLGKGRVSRRDLEQHGVHASRADEFMLAGDTLGEGAAVLIRIALDMPKSVRDWQMPHTARHESIHALRRMGLFTDDEWADLNDAARANDWTGKTEKPDTPKGREEAIADAFGAWAGGQKPVVDPAHKALVEKLFGRIVEFYRRLKEALAGRGIQRWEQIFADIESGAIGRRSFGGAGSGGRKPPSDPPGNGSRGEFNDGPDPGRRSSGSTTLHSNPFADPKLLKEAAPELIGAAVGGAVGHYEETGEVGISFKWAMAGAFAMGAGLRLPIKGKTFLGPDSHATAALDKGKGALKKRPGGKYFHPTGGVSDDLYAKVRAMRTATKNWQIDAVKLAKEVKENFTAAERAMMSDWIEKVDFPDEAGNTVPGGFAAADRRVKEMGDSLAGFAEDIGRRLVATGMLDDEVFQRLRGQYLHRYYTKHIGDKSLPQRVRESISGSWAKRRGEARMVAQPTGNRTPDIGDNVWQMTHAKSGKVRFVDDMNADTLEQGGWIRGHRWKVDALHGERMAIWRDYTPMERRAMGEVRDAAYRFARGTMEAANDLALGQMFSEIAANPRWAAKSPAAPDWVQVPDSRVGGTGLRKYGKLSGMYVHPEVMDAIAMTRKPWTSTQSAAWNGAMRSYLKALGAWKVGKTAYNPATHFNNLMGNVSLSLLAGDVGPIDVARALGALRRGDKVVEEARRAGLSLDTEVNVGDELASIEREIAALGTDTRSGWGRLFDLYLNNPITGLYNREDQMFKLASYMAQRRAGKTPDEAVAHAHNLYFDYSDVPLGVQAMRDFYAPFFSYTYKIAPVLARIAAEKPHRIVAAFGMLTGASMVSYGALYPDAPAAREDYEREVLPRWVQGNSALGAPRAIRLPMNREDSARPGEDRAMFLNSRYFLPGGDLLDFTNNSEVGPSMWPQALGATPLGGHPLPNIFYGMLSKKDAFFNKDIYPYPDTDYFDPEGPAWQKLANAKAMAKWLSFQVLPPSTTWTADKLGNAAVGEGALAKDGGVASFMGWTGTDFAGRQPSMEQVVLQSLGIKVTDVNPDEQEMFRQFDNLRRVGDAEERLRRSMRNEGVTESERNDRIRALGDEIDRTVEDQDKIQSLREAAGK